MSRVFKILFITFIIIIGIVFLFTIFIYKSTGYNYIYDNVNIVEDTSIGKNLYIVSKSIKIDTKNKNYKRVINDKISDVLKQEIDFENMIIIYNPYNTNKNSINLYFVTNDKVTVNYKLITVDNNPLEFKNVGDKYVDNHSYEIDGIVLGEVNILEIELRDKDNNLIGDNRIELDFSNVK